jgi:hypothetical protein
LLSTSTLRVLRFSSSRLAPLLTSTGLSQHRDPRFRAATSRRCRRGRWFTASGSPTSSDVVIGVTLASSSPHPTRSLEPHLTMDPTTAYWAARSIAERVCKALSVAPALPPSKLDLFVDAEDCSHDPHQRGRFPSPERRPPMDPDDLVFLLAQQDTSSSRHCSFGFATSAQLPTRIHGPPKLSARPASPTGYSPELTDHASPIDFCNRYVFTREHVSEPLPILAASCDRPKPDALRAMPPKGHRPDSLSSGVVSRPPPPNDRSFDGFTPT